MAVVAISDSILTDIADAIRSKNGQETLYKPSEMPDAIEAISGGGITPTGTIEITQNGVVDVTNYASADVAVPSVTPALGTKTITQNGTYAAEDDSLDGYSEVTVNVSGGSSGTAIDSDVVTTVGEAQSVYPGTGYNGLIITSKKPTLTNSWDFTESLVDSVGGLTATLSGATRDSSGVTIASSSQYITIPLKFAIRKTYELDIASINKSFSSGHGRVFMISGGEGFIAQNGSTWKCYVGSAWSATNGGTDLTILNGKTLTIKSGRITQGRTNGGNLSNRACLDFYIDGNPWFSLYEARATETSTNLKIGASDNSMCTMVVTGFRVYDGVEY